MQRYHLQAFPFDTQRVQLGIVTKQANEGAAPIEFVTKGGGAKPQLNLPTSFALADEWELGDKLVLEHEIYQPTNERSYPVVCTEACLRRKPAFYLLNICVPMAIFGIISFGQYALEIETYVADRLNFSLVTVLTAAAYKLATGQLVPHVSYVTALDIYVLGTVRQAQSGTRREINPRPPMATSVSVGAKPLSLVLSFRRPHTCLLAVEQILTVSLHAMTTPICHLCPGDRVCDAVSGGIACCLFAYLNLWLIRKRIKDAFTTVWEAAVAAGERKSSIEMADESRSRRESFDLELLASRAAAEPLSKQKERTNAAASSALAA